jgi:hypothetical protein
VGLLAQGLHPHRPAALEVPTPLAVRLVDRAGVARRELERLLRRQPGAQLPAPLELGVELGAEQQGEV